MSTKTAPLLLCLATQNRHKVAELQALLATLAPELLTRVTLTSLGELGISEEVVEDGSTFADNAIIKAKAACERTGLWALSDDSGLQVEALGGAPGIHSARWAGEPRSDERNLAKLLTELGQVPADQRQAHFTCALCLYGQPAGQAQPQVIVREGACRGSLRDTVAGGGGFGYDPLFVPDPAELAAAGLAESRRGLTFAELAAEEKNRLSHRTRALVALLPDLHDAAGLGRVGKVIA